MASSTLAECCNAKFFVLCVIHVECPIEPLYVECCYAEYTYAGYLYAECRGATR